MKALLGRFPLRYLTGEEIAAGDRIRIAGEDDGVVLAVFAPGTEDGRAYACPNGGFLYRCGRMGLVSMCDADEDIEFVSRGDPPAALHHDAPSARRELETGTPATQRLPMNTANQNNPMTGKGSRPWSAPFSLSRKERKGRKGRKEESGRIEEGEVE